MDKNDKLHAQMDETGLENMGATTDNDTASAANIYC